MIILKLIKKILSYFKLFSGATPKVYTFSLLIKAIIKLIINSIGYLVNTFLLWSINLKKILKNDLTLINLLAATLRYLGSKTSGVTKILFWILEIITLLALISSVSEISAASPNDIIGKFIELTDNIKDWVKDTLSYLLSKLTDIYLFIKNFLRFIIIFKLLLFNNYKIIYNYYILYTFILNYITCLLKFNYVFFRVIFKLFIFIYN